MPELPEVETIRRQLTEALVGKQIVNVEILNSKSWTGDKDLVTGSGVVDVRRKGKALIIDLENKLKAKIENLKLGNNTLTLKRRNAETLKRSLVIHLKMTGQLIYEPHGSGTLNHLQHRLVGGHPTSDFVSALPSSHTRVMIGFCHPELVSGSADSNRSNETLDQGRNSATEGTLYFNDQRKFGWVKLIPTSEVEKLKFIESLGKEPWEFTQSEWTKVSTSSKKPIKVRLMDQDQIAGVGNIYANDACWEAKIDPRRPSNTLNKSEAILLLEKVKLVLEEGINYGGATAMDGKYMNLQGLGGKYQEHFRIYQRNGKECLRKDGGVIQKVTLGGRGTYWCSKCQH